MSGVGESVEFEGKIDGEGKIAVPASVRLKMGTGSVHVTLTAKALADQLHRRNVTEAEIARIGEVQLESREQVVKFLLAEGALPAGRAKRKSTR